MARNTEVFELIGELARCIPPTTPSPARSSSTSPPTRWTGAGPAAPTRWPWKDAGAFLPECAFRGRQSRKLQFAVLAAAALRSGAEPDLLDEVAWRQTDDFCDYALYAAVAYIRAAADGASVPVRQVCRELAQRVGPQAE
jgi:hypothetical protein